MTLQRATVGLMLDIETLGNESTAVAWQAALFGWDLIDPTNLLPFPYFQYIPIQPQLDLLPARTVSASTLNWWFKQVAANPSLAEDFDRAEIEGIDELQAMLRGLVRTFDTMTNGGTADYELWTRGNFDLPIMGSLLRACGLPVPWDFRKCMDLRTLERNSGVSYKDVAQPAGFIKHRADWDCIFQISHHSACIKALSGVKE